MNEPLVPLAFDSRDGFGAALQWGLDQSVASGARRIVCVAPDLSEWPLDAPAWIDGLTSWLRLPQRRLVLLARNFDAVPRHCPRFSAWRLPWVHAIEAWQAPADHTPGLPCLLLADRGGVLVQVFDKLQWRGRGRLDDASARLATDEVDAVLQRSEPGFAATTLGL